MPKFMHPDVLDRGLQEVITKAAGNVDLLLISAYSAGESYSIVNGQKLASANLALGDLSLTDQGTNGRRLNIASKTLSTTVTSQDNDLHLAVVDVTNSKVLLVAEEASDRDTTTGVDIQCPVLSFDMNQPV